MAMLPMIERFALALDDRRNMPESEAAMLAAMEAELAERLRQLPNLSSGHKAHFATSGNTALAVAPEVQTDETERALREALEKLQRMGRG